MWVRLKAFLAGRDSTENPRQYVMNIISRWHLSELVSGRRTVILGDFNQIADKLSLWQKHHDLAGAHHNLHQIAQNKSPRPLYTYERSNARTHIDHIFHSHLGPYNLRKDRPLPNRITLSCTLTIYP
jgi:endonuclease/exonuclease/phosphatase family metal-dependent hydrolase